MNIQKSWSWLKGTRQGRFVLLLVGLPLCPLSRFCPDSRKEGEAGQSRHSGEVRGTSDDGRGLPA